MFSCNSFSRSFLSRPVLIASSSRPGVSEPRTAFGPQAALARARRTKKLGIFMRDYLDPTPAGRQ
jgi:hypothetical protein